LLALPLLSWPCAKGCCKTTPKGKSSARASEKAETALPLDTLRSLWGRKTSTTAPVSAKASLAPDPPYRLRKLPITHPNHVWCSDTTDIPVRHTSLDLVAIRVWTARKALDWRLSNTRDASFVVGALTEAPAKYGKPENMNTVQGSRLTGRAGSPP